MTALVVYLAVIPGACILAGWCRGVVWERVRGERAQRAKRFPTQPILGATLRKLAKFTRRRAREDEDRDGQR